MPINLATISAVSSRMTRKSQGFVIAAED